jgi:hypothetical protein
LLRSIESLSTTEKFPIRSYRRGLVWFLILYVFAIFYSIAHIGDAAGRAFSPVWVVVLAFVLWGFLIHLVVSIHRVIGQTGATQAAAVDRSHRRSDLAVAIFLARAADRSGCLAGARTVARGERRVMNRRPSSHPTVALGNVAARLILSAASA